MREDALITAVRTSARLSDSDTDYTDARIRQELTDALHQKFGHAITQARAGYWLKHYDVTTTASDDRYRIPHRASAGGLDSVSFADGSSAAYDMVGDVLVFDEPPAAGSVLRFAYYVRPSLLTQFQTAGNVTAIDTSARTVTVGSVPTNRVTAVAVATGDTIDIVHPNGWHELSLCNVAATLSGSVFTLPAGTEMGDIEVGDYVRAADQTDWPCIPDDFHRALADYTAARVLRHRGYEQKAQALEREAARDLEDFRDMIQPRVKNAPHVVVPRHGVIRGRSAVRWPIPTS